MNDPRIVYLGVALAIGMLIGAERERSKGTGPGRGTAGLRTFAVASLCGAVAFLAGGTLLLAVTTAGAAVLVASAYWRSGSDDPGLTTEVVLILTVLLGGFAMQEPQLAGGLAVVVTILLFAKARLHGFVRSVVSTDELNDALILAAATLVILPLLSDRQIGPYGALNPRSIWIVIVLVMGISAAGYVAVRLFGARFGLPLSGLMSGFISSTATIGAMGARAAKSPEALSAAVAGAVLSTVATILLTAVVVGATSLATLQSLMIPLVLAMGVAMAYGAVFTIIALRKADPKSPEKQRAFSLFTAFTFGGVLSAILLASAFLQDRFGANGVTLAVALAGLVDAQSGAISAASMVASGKMQATDAVTPVLIALSTNTVSKIAFAVASGGRAFAVRVVPGLLLVVIAAWLGALVFPTSADLPAPGVPYTSETRPSVEP